LQPAANCAAHNEEVFRAENVIGIVFEELTVVKVEEAVQGPNGPISGAIVVDELGVSGGHSLKTLAPGYGEFLTADGPDLEPVAVASPTDAQPGGAPVEIRKTLTAAWGTLDLFADLLSGYHIALYPITHDPSLGWLARTNRSLGMSRLWPLPSCRARVDSARAKGEQRDLARCEDPQWWSPETGAATRVELAPLAVLAEPLEDRLVEAHQVVEGPDLATVGVSGDLQVDAMCDGAVYLLRLVCEQQHRQQGAGAGQGRCMVGMVAAQSGRGGRTVVDAGDD
jgi:hypothetical protein